MRRALVAIAAAALAAVPSAAQAAAAVSDGPRYGTENCYVEVDPPPSIIVSTEPPFVHIPPTGGPGTSVHCPISR